MKNISTSPDSYRDNLTSTSTSLSVTKALFSFLLFCLCLNVKGQYATINPDFATWLFDNGYASCLKPNNQLDTTSNLVLQATSIIDTTNTTQIRIDGIKYFKNLKNIRHIYVDFDTTQLPASLQSITMSNGIIPFSFPAGLKYLSCQAGRLGGLKGLPQFPSGLEYLDVSYINFDTLENLPNSLKVLKISGSPYKSITIPSSLESLVFEECNIDSIGTLPSTLKHIELVEIYNSNFQWPQFPSGIEYLDISFCQAIGPLYSFPSVLDSLVCEMSGYAGNMPTLPSGLIYLNCMSNDFTTLINLPSNLKYLNCSYNKLKKIDNLPPNLEYLDCSRNMNIDSVNNLPSTLKYFVMDNCFTLKANPKLPSNLEYFSCYSSNIDSLADLPATLKYLDCGDGFATQLYLPSIPPNLEFLYCRNNNLNDSIFPSLPTSLKHLDCDACGLTQLPNLHEGLIGLLCSSNKFRQIPKLPNSLKTLLCQNNMDTIEVFPSFPDTIEVNLHSSLVKKIQNIPKLFQSFSAGHNLLTEIPAFRNATNGTVNYFFARNQLSHLNTFPDSFHYFDLNFNPIKCLPKLPSVGHIYILGNPQITCVPNLPNSSNFSITGDSFATYAICDIYNENGCEYYYNISGKVYDDANKDCTVDTNDRGIPNIRVSLFKDGKLWQTTTTSNWGNYSFDADTGNYTIQIDTSRMHLICPASGIRSATITLTDTIKTNLDFAVTCKPGFDIGITDIGSNEIFFPGDTTPLKIYAGDIASLNGLQCGTNQSGKLTLNYTGKAKYIGTANGALPPSSVSGNTFTYDIADWGKVNFYKDFGLLFQTDTTAANNDEICVEAWVTPKAGDNDTANNHYKSCFYVRTSHDPNDKAAYPKDSRDTSIKWMDYTVRFQNTGSAAARHIYILDTLDANFDASTFTLLDASHMCIPQLLTDRVVKFNLPNINLPDSNADEPSSHGFVKYKVKQKPNLPLGTEITNTAYIYFDFNSPVVTNTTSNILKVVNSINYKPGTINYFSIYPNPAKDFATIDYGSVEFGNGKSIKLTLTDMMGKELFTTQLNRDNHTYQLSLQSLSQGTYLVSLNSENRKVVVGKLVK